MNRSSNNYDIVYFVTENLAWPIQTKHQLWRLPPAAFNESETFSVLQSHALLRSLPSYSIWHYHI